MDGHALVAVREHLERGLARVAACSAGAAYDGRRPGTPEARLVRIGHFQVAQALNGRSPRDARPPGPGGRAGAFRWTARTARRSVGLAALRAGLDGRAPSPAEAVALVLSDPGGPFGVGRAGPGSCAEWIGALPPPARALVAAEATAWTTRLWTGVDWGRVDAGGLDVGGPERWWRWRSGPTTPTTPTTPTGSAMPAVRNGPDPWEVALRGRADVRAAPAPRSQWPSTGAHLIVLDGEPAAGTRQALLLSALVAALSAAGSAAGSATGSATRSASLAAAVPGRVVGWWPDCGKAWVLPVDQGTLAAASDAVVATLGMWLGAGAPGEAGCGQ